MLLLIRILVLLSFISVCKAQNEALEWRYGAGGGLDFRYQPPKALPLSKGNAFEANACICDPVSGKTILYSNGVELYNGNDEVIYSNLKSGLSSTQGVMIIPKPGKPRVYYVFTVNDLTGMIPRPVGMWYLQVDMNARNGRGAVVGTDTMLVASCAECLTGSFDCTRQEWNIVTYSWINASFYTIKVNNRGVSRTPIVTTIGYALQNPNFRTNYSPCAARLSPDRRHLCLSSDEKGYAEVFDFNEINGTVSNGQLLILDPSRNSYSPYSAEFSASGKYLYVTNGYLQKNSKNGTLVRFNMNAANRASSLEVVYNPTKSSSKEVDISGICRAVDGRIYVVSNIYTKGQSQSTLMYVTFPDSSLSKCAFVPDMGTNYSALTYGLPNIPSALLDSKTFGCPSQFLDFDVDSVCEGERLAVRDYSLEMGDSTAVWKWTMPGAAPNSSSDKSGPTALYQSPGLYQITLLIKTKGGSDSLTKNVLVYPRPRLLSHDTILCPGQKVVLRATGGSSYVWRNRSIPGVMSIADSVVVQPDVTSWYTVSADTPTGCLLEDTVRVAVFTVAIQTRDTSVCSGSPATLIASGGTQYEWQDSLGAVVGRTDSLRVLPEHTTQYKVRVRQGLCVDSAIVRVNVKDKPEVSVQSDVTVCQGDSVHLRIAKPQSAVLYRWWRQGSPILTQGAGVDLIADSSTVFYVEGVNALGCKDTASAHVTVWETAKVTALASADKICAGDSTTLTVATVVSGVNYTWYEVTTNAVVGTSSSVTVAPSQSTDYRVVGRLGDCYREDTTVIQVSPTPTVRVKDLTVCEGQPAVAIATRSSDATISWFDTKSVLIGQGDTIVIHPKGSAQYYASGINSSGCSVLDSFNITVNRPPDLNVAINTVDSTSPGDSLKLLIRLKSSESIRTPFYVTLRYPNEAFSISGEVDKEGYRYATIPIVGLDSNIERVVTVTGLALQSGRTSFTIEVSSLLELDTSCATVKVFADTVRVTPVCASSLYRLKANDLNLMVSPNPVYGENIAITSNKEVQRIEMWDEVGRQLGSFDVRTSTKIGSGATLTHVYSIQAPASGLYYLRVFVDNSCRSVLLIVAR